ncbi:MAG: flagellar basal body P-ring formation protein FlgA [Planctomycetota bacterium]|nr:MAG: flagellar basal body P-ring formation protein FlgA [Planctomycetota bacterium]
MTIALALLFAGGLTVTLPSEVRVAGTELSLGDVATVTGDDAIAAERLRALGLGYTPAPGYTRLLRRDHLAAQIARALPGVEVHFAGEDRCRVAPEVEHIAGARIRAAAEAEIARMFAGREAEVRLEGKLRDEVLPMGESPAKLEPMLTEHELRPGTWSVPVRLVVDGAVYKTVWTTWAVELWETRIVLVRDVARGETLAPDLFTLKRVLVSANAGAISLPPAALDGAVLVRALAAGSPVSSRDVTRPKAIVRGDLVSLEIRRGLISARALAVAKQDGRIGDRIRVVLQATGREMFAVVLSSELVGLQMNGRRR